MNQWLTHSANVFSIALACLSFYIAGWGIFDSVWVSGLTVWLGCMAGFLSMHVGHGDGELYCDRRVNGVTAAPQDLAADLGRLRLGRGDNATLKRRGECFVVPARRGQPEECEEARHEQQAQ